MIGMARSLVSPDNRYPEGRAHVLPLLMGSLPGPALKTSCCSSWTGRDKLASQPVTLWSFVVIVALQKLYNFATSSIFETCVSGRMVADMCKAAAKVIRVDGEQLLKYQGELERILHVCVSLRCKQVYTHACSLLEHTLRSLSLIYPTEYRCTPGGFNTNLPIQVKTH
ncbi:hypothetical protein XENOCAPTIV_012123 [Xenoophorus captivus]|uniref:Proteasome activator Blm10 middle HEAT repeats region domain-containing protein n=1 Tax=Xenoophorus captivus TaxID=1517983 RepID=A0ABV0R2E3_9TELE